MNEWENEELNSAIARYMPDRQLITFSTGMIILPKGEGEESGFSDIRKISFFFHEWMHYLHNISTLHGVSAFVALTEIWSAFRRTTDNLGISSGKIDHATPELFQVKDLMEIFTAARKGSAPQPMLSSIAPEKVAVRSYTEQGALKNGGFALLNIPVVLTNNEGDQTDATIMLGPGEILESAAFLLEKRFLERLAQRQVDPAPVVPYHVLTIFAKHVAPSLTEEDVLLCGLACLQSTAPVSDLVRILKGCESIDPRADARRQYLTNMVVKQMKLREPEYLLWLDRLDAMFPYSQSIGGAVQETIAFMRKNLEMRKQRPFFELDLIEEMYAAGPQGFHALMDSLMTVHGMCAGKQEHYGSNDEIGRDMLFDFAAVGRDHELSEARRVMQASFDYVLRHFSTDWSFRSTAEASQRPCPFYTSCVESTRKEKPEDCRTRPWLSVHSSRLCWYAEGVINLKPGAPENEFENSVQSPDVD
jgi:hypothetical protein